MGEPVLALANDPRPADANRMHPNKATMTLTTMNHLCHFLGRRPGRSRAGVFRGILSLRQRRRAYGQHRLAASASH